MSNFTDAKVRLDKYIIMAPLHASGLRQVDLRVIDQLRYRRMAGVLFKTISMLHVQSIISTCFECHQSDKGHLHMLSHWLSRRDVNRNVEGICWIHNVLFVKIVSSITSCFCYNLEVKIISMLFFIRKINYRIENCLCVQQDLNSEPLDAETLPTVPLKHYRVESNTLVWCLCLLNLAINSSLIVSW